MSIPPFVSIKKFDGSYKEVNLNQVVSVEMILSKEGCYYEIVDTNGKTHLSDSSPFYERIPTQR